MHCRLQLACKESIADLCDKCAALAAMRQKLVGLVDIARGIECDHLDLEVGSRRGEPACDFVGLRQRHDAFARADPETIDHKRRSARDIGGVSPPCITRIGTFARLARSRKAVRLPTRSRAPVTNRTEPYRAPLARATATFASRRSPVCPRAIFE